MQYCGDVNEYQTETVRMQYTGRRVVDESTSCHVARDQINQ